MGLKRVINSTTHFLGFHVQPYENKHISLKPQGPSKGNVLLSYTINPFLRKDGDAFDDRHTCDWECYHIAKIFLERGYSVDVINYTNENYVPKKDYSYFIDALTNMERIAPLLNKNCVKILHCVFAHWLFHNTAQYQRCLNLKKRRGIALRPRRLLTPNLGIETADCATIIGNGHTISTFNYVQKPMYRLSVSTQRVYSWPEDKDFDQCRRRFLWFGSGGLIHKGLDLVLEAFSDMPDYRLTVCGPVNLEKEFESAYYKELYETSNVDTKGWIDVHSTEFLDIARNCVGLIYPSCSEGQSGGVISCMHAGLIPILSLESGVDAEEFGIILKDCSIEEIKASLKQVSNLPAEDLKKFARNAWEYARNNNTREKFLVQYRQVITEIMEQTESN